MFYRITAKLTFLRRFKDVAELEEMLAKFTADKNDISKQCDIDWTGRLWLVSNRVSKL